MALLDFFSPTHRLDRRLRRAGNIKDPERSLAKLRQILPEFREADTAWSHLWDDCFLAMLDPERAELLTEEDLRELKRLGIFHQQKRRHSVPGKLWRPLVRARAKRREQALLRELLAELHGHPDTEAKTRTWAATNLLARGGDEPSHVRIYIKELPKLEAEHADKLLPVLSSALGVDFSSSRQELREAAATATALGDRNIAKAAAARARGMAALYVDEDDQAAGEHFDFAFAIDPLDEVAWCGAMLVALRAGNIERADELVSSVVSSPGSDVAALLRLARSLLWFERASKRPTPPESATDLAELELPRGVAHVLHYTVGRAHLVEGDAHAAVDHFVAAESGSQGHPNWAYYMGAAFALAGRPAATLDLYETAAEPAAHWPLACLVLDACPRRAKAKDSRVRACLEDVPEPHRAAIQSRLTLLEGRVAPPVLAEPSNSVQPHDLELFKITLGSAFVRKEWDELERARGSAAFARLPRAERVFWSGVSQLESDRDRAHAELREAADVGHPRAALLLAVELVRLGRAREARYFLDLVPDQADPKVGLVRAHLAQTYGRQLDAEAILGDLEQRGETRGNYAQARLCLDRASRVWGKRRAERIRDLREQAADLLEAALADPDVELPADASILARCARFAADPTERNLEACAAAWNEIASLDKELQSPWVRWTAGVAQLASGGDAVDPDTCAELLDVMEQSEHVSDATRNTMAFVLTAACQAASDPQRAERFAELLARVVDALDDGQGNEFLTRARFAVADLEGDHMTADAIDALTRELGPSIGLSLLTARLALESGDTAAAVESLRAEVSRLTNRRAPEHEASQSASDDFALALLQALSRLMRGESPEGRLEPPVGFDPAMEAACHLIFAAQCFLEDDGKKGFDSLQRAERVLGDLSPIVDLKRYFAWLCATSRRKEPSAELMEMFDEVQARGSVDPATLARYAAAIGDRVRAREIYKQALEQESEDSVALGAEYRGVMFHEATLALRDGNRGVAISRLREALATWK